MSITQDWELLEVDDLDSHEDWWALQLSNGCLLHINGDGGTRGITFIPDVKVKELRKAIRK